MSQTQICNQITYPLPFIQVPKGEQRQVPQTLAGRSTDAANGDKKTIKVDIADIVSVSACADLTLPPGAGLCIDTIHEPVYLVSNIQPI